MSPRSASFGKSSIGKCCDSSHSMTCGRISASANSRTVRRSSSCSSVGRKSIDRSVQGKREKGELCSWHATPSLLPFAFCLFPLSPSPVDRVSRHHRLPRREPHTHGTHGQ